MSVFCAKCDKELDNLLEEGHQPMSGLAFSTTGHYGSGYFDPMNGSYLELTICDECVEKLEKDGKVFRKETGIREFG